MLSSGHRHVDRATLSRRAALRTWTGILASATAAALLEACTTSAPPAGPTQSAPSQPGSGTSAAAPSGATETPRSGGTLKIIASPAVATPTLAATVEVTNGVQFTLSEPIFDSLFAFADDGSIIPRLATAEISPDNRSMVFRLRPGAKFQDGTPFDAESVRYHLANMKYGAFRFSSIESTEALDPATVKLNLSHFDATLLPSLAILYGQVSSPTAAQKPTTPANQARDHAVGAGAFTLTDFQRDTRVTYAKYANYWNKGRPYLDGLQIDIVADPVTASVSFQAGQANVLRDISPKTAKELADKGYRIVSSPTLMRALSPDGANPDSPFADLKVRMAVEHAIDRKGLADSLAYGYFEPAGQIGHPQFPQTFNPAIQPRAYDVARAKQLLTEAGKGNGFSTEIIAQQSDDRQVLAALQGYLKAVGIDATITAVAPARFSDIRTQGWKNGLLFDTTGVQPNYISPLQTAFDVRGVYNRSIYRPTGFQETIDKAAVEPSDEARTKLLHDVVQMNFDQAITIPIWTEPQLVAMDNRVRGGGLYMRLRNQWDAADLWLAS